MISQPRATVTGSDVTPYPDLLKTLNAESDSNGTKLGVLRVIQTVRKNICEACLAWRTAYIPEGEALEMDLAPFLAH
jgi:hypothetical protein